MFLLFFNGGMLDYEDKVDLKQKDFFIDKC